MAGFDRFFTAAGDDLDYDALVDAFAWVRAMAATPQDPRYHAEGDVWTHTRMVCRALTRDDEWPRLSRAEHRLMLTAALLHDAGKPETTFTDADGRIRSPDHSLRGETIARRVLWQLDEPFATREHAAALVRHHMQPRYIPEQKDPRRRLYAMSYVLRCDLLAMLARADTRGRIAPDEERALAASARFVDICRMHDCLATPRAFVSDHARFLYFRRSSDDPDAVVPPPAGPRMTVMSGLPGSGKDTWIRQHMGATEVVSLDAIRAEIGVSPTDDQKPVVELAHRRALRLLADHTDFVWNATTLSRRHRKRLLDIAAHHDPHVHFVHLDASPALLFPRNRARPAHAIVPEDVIDRMTAIWQPPDLTEAHRVDHVVHERRPDVVRRPA